MTNDIHTRIDGEFHGCGGSSIFKLANGQVWQQNIYRYEYRYAYQPVARLFHDGRNYMLEVPGMSQPIPVVRVDFVEDGTIVSNFTGFSQDARFEFQSGRIWLPAEYKYCYHYEYRPPAIIVDGVNGLERAVEGMSETLRVRRGN